MTEDEARAALAAFDGLGGLERWVAAQRPWEAAPGGWTVADDFQGWRFRVEPAPGGVRVIASAGRGEPAVWVVPVAIHARATESALQRAWRDWSIQCCRNRSCDQFSRRGDPPYPPPP